MKPLHRHFSVVLLLVRTLVATSVLSGCAGRDPHTTFEEDTLELRPITWNSQATSLGRVQAVADSQEDVGVFGDKGASVFSGGIQVGSDDAVKSWRTAAVVPALDLPETWLLGVDQLGRVYRMRNRVLLEDVTARLGLVDRPVLEVVALSSSLSAFALKDKVAVVDGSAVWFYEIRARGMAGAAGRLAAFDWEGVLAIDLSDPQNATLLRLPLEEIIAVAFDVTGALTLVAATEHALYAEKEGSLVKVWDAPAESKITGLSGSGRGVWVGLGKELALLRGSQLSRSTSAVVPDGARLIGSPSGDVWLLGGPQLLRMGERALGGTDEDRWRRTILPIFHRICRSCHLPGGSGGTDLSTYAQWATRRPVLKQRIIDQTPTPMPPPGAGTLTQDELAAVQLWANSEAK